MRAGRPRNWGSAVTGMAADAAADASTIHAGSDIAAHPRATEAVKASEMNANRPEAMAPATR